MFLKEISIQNFKCLEDIKLSFASPDGQIRKWTLLLGENGTGKSNFLKAIALVTAGSNAIGSLLSDVNGLIRNGADECRIEAVLVTKAGLERRIALELRRDNNLSDIIQKNSKSLQLIDGAIENADRNYFVVGYGPHRRLADESLINLEKDKYARYNNIKNLFSGSLALNHLSSWIIDLDYRFGLEGIALVKETLDNFLPGTRFHKIDKDKKVVLFKTADGEVPLSSLSDGYKNMAAWIGDLLYRVTQMFGDYQRPLAARGLLLIDEIDLHLHPKWQRHLLDFIGNKLPNFQVIATTHSPLTAQQANEGELYALTRESDSAKVSILPFVGSPKKLLVNQLLMTPVFGLQTDESLEVETAKREYRQLSARRGNLNASQQAQFRKAQETLGSSMPKRNTSAINDDEIDMLKRIEEKLKIR